MKINFKPYDPFEILGVSSSAGESEIKNAFKKLSRLHHPDKAKEEKRSEAEKRFVEINKAYKALTDEKIRKNWEEYGNPDGIRTFALGVALPSWLVNSSNRIILLALYCIAFGVGLPLIVKRWWTSSKEFTKDGIRHASMTMFFRELKENSSLKKVLELLSNSSEFSVDLPQRESDAESMNNLMLILSEYRDMNGDRYEKPRTITSTGAIKAHALIFCHFYRIDVTDSNLVKDQIYIIAKTAQLVQGIIKIALARQWLVPAIHCMNISQYLVQGMWQNRSPLLQLPHVPANIVKHAIIGKRSIKNIADLLDMTEKDRRALLQSLNDTQYNELLSVAQTFPICNVEAVTFRILGQEQITPSGLITCQVLLSLEYPSLDLAHAEDDNGKNKIINSETDDVQTFEFDEDGNLLDDPGKKLVGSNAAPRPIYSPRFPSVKRPSWWVVLINRNNTNLISTPIKVSDLVDRKTVTLQLPAPSKPMSVTVKLLVISDSFVGADIEKEVAFTVHPPSENSPTEHWDISGDEEDQAVPFAENEGDED